MVLDSLASERILRRTSTTSSAWRRYAFLGSCAAFATALAALVRMDSSPRVLRIPTKAVRPFRPLSRIWKRMGN